MNKRIKKKDMIPKPIIIKPKINNKTTHKVDFKKLMKTLKIDETFTKPTKKYKFDKVKENTFPQQDFNFMADILMLPIIKETKQRYLLVVVDLWSNEFDIEPLITKTAKECLEAFKTIIKRPYLKLPQGSIRTDNGGEFKDVFHTFLKDNNINHRLSNPHRHKQNANVESLNLQLGRIFMTYLTNMELKTKNPYHKWTDILEIVRVELNKVRKIPDGNPFNLEPILYNDDIPKFKVGDVVIHKLDHPKNAMGRNETTEQFRQGDIRWDLNNKLKIIKVLNYPNNNRYILNKIKNVSFVEAELKLSNAKEEYFEIKQILDRYYNKNKKSYYYKIWWKGYLKKDTTWEPYKKLIEDGFIKELNEFDSSIIK